MKTVPIAEGTADYPVAFVIESEHELKLLYLSMNQGHESLKGTSLVDLPPTSKKQYHSMWSHFKNALIMRGVRD